MLMLGVTLSIGSAVAVAAINQFGQESGSASVAGTLQQASQGKLVSLVYAVVTPGSGGCTTVFQGTTEGKTITFVLYNYGSANFSPTNFYDNSTIYSSSYSTLPAGGMTTYGLTLLACAHSSGQTLAASDSSGDEIQVAT